jgi:DNA-binding SARP family transcriptional activator
MAQLSLSLLGPLQITLDGDPLTTLKSDKVRALFAYLAVEANRPHRREKLAGLLWPEQPEQDARSNLRHALSNLHKVTDNQKANPPFLLVSRQTVQFNVASDAWVDVVEFTRLLEAPTPSPRDLKEAVDLYQGEFLEGFSIGDSVPFEEWAIIKREQIRRRALSALHQLAAAYEERGEYGRALPYAWRQVELEPWQEKAHRQVMRLLALNGQRGAALAQYKTCRQALAEELDVEPAQETTRVYERIRDGEVAPLPQSPTPASISAAASPEAPQVQQQPSRRAIDSRLILAGAVLLLIAVIVGTVLVSTGRRTIGGQTPLLTRHPPPVQEGKVVDPCEDLSPPQICVSHLQSHQVVQTTSYLTFDQIGPLMSWSPSGDQIAFDAGGDPALTYHGHDLYIINADGSDLRQITDSNAYDTNPAWSPDGQWIAFGRDGTLWIVRPDGSEAQAIWDEGDETHVWGMAWSMDSQRIAFLNAPHLAGNPTSLQLWSIDPEGSDPLLTCIPQFSERVGKTNDFCTFMSN